MNEHRTNCSKGVNGELYAHPEDVTFTILLDLNIAGCQKLADKIFFQEICHINVRSFL